MEDGISFHYPFFVNIKALRRLCLTINTFFYVFFWGLGNRKNKCIICDVLNQSVCIGGLWAAKIVGIKTIGLVTDMPGMIVEIKDRTSLGARFRLWSNKQYLSLLSGYIFIAEAANEVLNLKGKPYMVMEGMVESVQNDDSIDIDIEDERFTILYAGGIFKQYGSQLLVRAVQSIAAEN